ncbi:hypothetical protein ACP4OV_002993 [Aristida adscensionis]
MGPAKASRKTNKIIIKRYEDQQQREDSPSSNKKRKITDLGPKWSKDELLRFYGAYRRYGKDWKKISAAVGKSSVMVKALYNMHPDFLSLPERRATPMGFIALVSGHCNVMDESPTHRGNSQMVRTSGKAKKLGEAKQQKVHEAAHPGDSCHEGRFPGFSASFKKRYYGGLGKEIRSHAVGNRTPRIPIIVSAHRNATDDTSPEVKNAISFTKKNNEEINNYHTNLITDDCSPDGKSGIREATKAIQGQTFLETRGTGDAEICQTQQHLKKRRVEQTMDGSQTSKIEHETMMEAKEGNGPLGLLNKQQGPSEFFSADDLLVLDVLQSLVDATDKMSILKINIPPGTLGKSDSTLSRRKNQGQVHVDPPNQSKPLGECSASKTKQKWHTKLFDAELPAEETNIAHATDIPMGSLNSDSAKGMSDLLESTANIPDMTSTRSFPLTHDYFSGEKIASLSVITVVSPMVLTRCEWSIIRRTLGKPRRFSDHFLVVEKEKLENHRREVREYYGKLSDGSLDSLRPDLAQPFSNGQQVIACHPNSRELCDGKVVMVEGECCKVQFDNADLGVHVVKDTDCMPANWLDMFSVRNILEKEHIQKVRPSGTCDNTRNGNSTSEMPINLHTTSDEQLKAVYSVERERLPRKSTSDDNIGTRGFPNSSFNQSHEIESYVTAFVQNSQSEASKMVDRVKQMVSEGIDSLDEEAGTWNQVTNFMGLKSEAADAQLPSDLIQNCTATLLAIKRHADLRHPPANIAGVLEQMSSMLRPRCSENLSIYEDIERLISIIKSQLVALVPTPLCNACCCLLPNT